jgi:MFS family permease
MTHMRGHSLLPRAAALLGLALWAVPVLAQDPQGPRQLASLLLLPVSVLALGALQAVLAALFPRWTAATVLAVQQRRGVCVLWGLLLFLFTAIVTVLLAAMSQTLGALGVLFLLVLLLMALAGSPGIAVAFGARLLPTEAAPEDRTTLQGLVGGLTLSFAAMAPVVGQLLALLLLLASSGATAVTLFARPPAKLPQPLPKDEVPG